MSFAAKHGMWLQEFGIVELGDEDKDLGYMKKFLIMCPNLKKVDIIFIDENFSEIIKCQLLMKLKVIKTVYFDQYESQILELLVNKYGTSLKEIEIFSLVKTLMIV